MHNSVVDQAS